MITQNTSVPGDAPTDGGRFNTTHWSVVLLAGQGQSSEGEAALELLCRSYWRPLYAYIRRKGHSAHDAQDLTQNFFARMLEKRYLGLAEQERGKFRSFLLKSLNHFLINDWARNQAQKRGGGQRLFSLDQEAAEQAFVQEPALHLEPETLYDKRWAVTLLENALDRLRQEYAAAGKRVLFDQLNTCLLAEASGEIYRRIGEALGMNAGAVKVAVHRLRGRLREVVRIEVAQTVADPGEVDEELRYLMAALKS